MANVSASGSNGPNTGVTASQQLASLGTTLPTGQYEITIYASVSGTITAAEVNNLKLLGVAPAISSVPMGPIAGMVISRFVVNYVTGSTLQVLAVALGGVAAVYAVVLEARQIADWEGESS